MVRGSAPAYLLICSSCASFPPITHRTSHRKRGPLFALPPSVTSIITMVTRSPSSSILFLFLIAVLAFQGVAVVDASSSSATTTKAASAPLTSEQGGEGGSTSSSYDITSLLVPLPPTTTTTEQQGASTATAAVVSSSDQKKEQESVASSGSRSEGEQVGQVLFVTPLPPSDSSAETMVPAAAAAAATAAASKAAAAAAVGGGNNVEVFGDENGDDELLDGEVRMPKHPPGPPPMTPEEHKAKANELASHMNETLAAHGGQCEGVDNFADFLTTQGKEYNDAQAIANHCGQFAQAKRFADDFATARPEAPFKVGLNNFSDWSDNDLKNLRGLHPPGAPKEDVASGAVDMTTVDLDSLNRLLPRRPYNVSQMTKAQVNGSAAYNDDEEFPWDDPQVPSPPTTDSKKRRLGSLPTYLDYRYKTANPFGVVALTSVKNQGSCGCCYAFATAALVEAQVALTYGTNYTRNLSPQQVVDCSTVTNGCDGGGVDQALLYIKNNVGLRTLTSYSYAGKEKTCNGSAGAYMTVTGVNSIKACDANQLMTALYYQGPVSVYIKSNCKAFTSYAGGVIDDDCITTAPNNNRTASVCSSQVDHAVLLVGYGTDTTTGLDYWVIRNSWGTSWGEGGYARIKRTNALGPCQAFCLAAYPMMSKQVYMVGTAPPEDDSTDKGDSNKGGLFGVGVSISYTQAVAAGAGAAGVLLLVALATLLRCFCCKANKNSGGNGNGGGNGYQPSSGRVGGHHHQQQRGSYSGAIAAQYA